MRTEHHLDDISVVIGANLLGWLPTIFQFEEVFRFLGLVAAFVYTVLKIIEWFRENKRRQP